MRTDALSKISDEALLRELAALVARERHATADLLDHLAEAEARKLYAAAGHSSMHSYCVHELHLSDAAAFKRIRAARAAREYPAFRAASPMAGFI